MLGRFLLPLNFLTPRGISLPRRNSPVLSRLDRGLYGAYINFQQKITRTSTTNFDTGLSVFLNAGVADRKTAVTDFQIAAGLDVMFLGDARWPALSTCIIARLMACVRLAPRLWQRRERRRMRCYRLPVTKVSRKSNATRAAQSVSILPTAR